MKFKIHFRNTRLTVNAGIDFPECYTAPKSGRLDVDKSRLPTSGDRREVTCKRCLAALNRRRS